jgi:hypothetical protein
MPHEKIELAFTTPIQEVSNETVRDFILVSKGRYHTLPPGTLIDPTVYGYWVAPICYDWHTVEVVVDLPSTTTLVKVIIHGRGDLQAYIDYAMFTITDIKKVETDYGFLAVALDVISWRDSAVRAVISLAAYARNSSYGIRATKLQSELLPDTQKGWLNITYASQANDQNIEVDPAQVKGQRDFTAFTIAYTLGQVAGLAAQLVIIFFQPELMPYSYYIKTIAGTVTSQAVRNALRGWVSEPENRLAGYGYETSAVWEQWDYPTLTLDYPKFVSVASGEFNLLWWFDKYSGDSFQVGITAWVNWGKVVYQKGSEPIGTPDKYHLYDCGWSSAFLAFTVYA